METQISPYISIVKGSTLGECCERTTGDGVYDRGGTRGRPHEVPGTQRNNAHDEKPRHTMSSPGPRFSPYITIVNRSFAIYYGNVWGKVISGGGHRVYCMIFVEAIPLGSWGPTRVPPLLYATSPVVLSHDPHQVQVFTMEMYGKMEMS